MIADIHPSCVEIACTEFKYFLVWLTLKPSQELLNSSDKSLFACFIEEYFEDVEIELEIDQICITQNGQKYAARPPRWLRWFFLDEEEENVSPETALLSLCRAIADDRMIAKNPRP